VATLSEINRAVEGTLEGSGDVEITGVASLESAGPGDIAPLVSDRFLKVGEESRAGVFLIADELAGEFDRPCIRSAFPLAALNRAMEVLGLVAPPPPPGVHPSAVVEDGAEIGEGAHVGALAYVAAGARIGARSALHARVVVESGVQIGEDCVIRPGAVLEAGSVLGDRVHIGANAVLSRQGFGFTPGPAGPVHLHHIGRVVIEDDAHIGAISTVDRARFDDTRVGRHSKIDSQVHIGHNCTIGERTFVAAQAGMAGNSHIGSNCEVGGQVGVGNLCGVGDRVRIGGQSGVTRMHGDDLELWGCPAIDKREYMREISLMRKLVKKS